jgi:hypothetical protein
MVISPQDVTLYPLFYLPCRDQDVLFLYFNSRRVTEEGYAFDKLASYESQDLKSVLEKPEDIARKAADR